MSYAAQHLLLRAHGTFGAINTEINERFSYSMRIFLGASSLDESKKASFLAAVATPMSVFFAAPATTASTRSYLKQLTAAYIGMDGKYVGGDAQPTTEYNYPTPIAGSGAVTQPYSSARVYTLRSDIDRGPGHAGRFYMPTGAGVDSSGRWALVDCQLAADLARTLIDAINTAARVEWSPASAVSVFSNKGPGTIGTVTTVSVGRAPDTQRRRDNQLVEEYANADLSTTFAARDKVATRVYT